MFKDVVGYEDYFQISDDGEVLSKRTGKILKQWTSKKGYKLFSSRIGGRKGKAICLKVHRMVAEAFVDNLENKPYVNHLDGNKTNNLKENLEWCTPLENTTHAILLGLINKDTYNPQRGEKNINSILTEEDVRNIRSLYVPKKFGKRKIAKFLNLPLAAVNDVCRGKNWKHVI